MISISSTLLFFTIVSIILWYIRYVWSRRKLYEAASKRPGPFPLPILGNIFTFMGSSSDKLDNVDRLLKSYESPVRLWLCNKLLFMTEDLRDMQVISTSPNALNRGDILLKNLKRTINEGVFTARHQKWRRTRKIINPTFSPKILDGFVPIMSERAVVFAEILNEKAGKGMFDVEEALGRCTLDILCETAMGTKLDLQVNKNDFVDQAHKTMEIATVRIFSFLYQSDFLFNISPLGAEFERAASGMCNFVDRVVQDKKAAYRRKLEENKNVAALEEGDKRKSFLEHMIEFSEKGAVFTDEDLRYEVNTLLVAGTDTSTMFNCFALLMIGMRPELQEKLYQEVIDVTGPDRSIESNDLPKLQLLERVIKETLRLFPVGAYVTRETTDEIHLDKVTIPAGCTLILAIFNIHRNRKNYPDPYTFNPDRFLPEEASKRHPYAYVPFGMGNRSCIGMRYAVMVSKVILATVIRKYKIFADYEDVENMKLALEITLKRVGGCQIALECRN